MSSDTAIASGDGFEGDGFSAQELFGSQRKSCYAYTYDDIILLPGHIDVSLSEVSLAIQLRNH